VRNDVRTRRPLRAAIVQEDRTVVDFWDRVKTNLAAGRIRLLFVADSIPSELKRIVSQSADESG
jgi:hypothetical protein